MDQNSNILIFDMRSSCDASLTGSTQPIGMIVSQGFFVGDHTLLSNSRPARVVVLKKATVKAVQRYMMSTSKEIRYNLKSFWRELVR